jgi:hypothetical protein
MRSLSVFMSRRAALGHKVVLTLALVLVLAAAPTHAQLRNVLGLGKRQVLLALDISGSAFSGGHDNPYRSYFTLLMNSLRDGDEFTVGFINATTLGNGAYPVSFIVPEKSFAENNIVYRARRDRALREQDRRFDAAIADAKPSAGSEIMSFLNLAARRFEQNKGGVNQLVLVTDGIEESSEPEGENFARHILDEKTINTIIEKQRNRKTLPDLGGAAVYFVTGAVSVDARGAASFHAQQLLGIEHFWRAYIAAANGKLISFDSDLLAFNR